LARPLPRCPSWLLLLAPEVVDEPLDDEYDE